MTYDFDAIVIGSGVSGGWAAKELTEKGLKVLMLDRGRMVEHKKDYITEGMGPWKLPYRGTLPIITTALIPSTMRIPSRFAGCGPTWWAASRCCGAASPCAGVS
jgi:choline dehydrogenase-like flavoprotein